MEPGRWPLGVDGRSLRTMIGRKRCCCDEQIPCSCCQSGFGPPTFLLRLAFDGSNCANCPDLNGTYEVPPFEATDGCGWGLCFDIDPVELCGETISGLSLGAVFQCLLNPVVNQVILSIGYKRASQYGCETFINARIDRYIYDFGASKPDCFTLDEIELVPYEPFSTNWCQGFVYLSSP